MRFDKLKGVMTLPVKLGVNISISIAIILLFLFILLMGIDFLYFKLNLRMAFALFLSAILTIILLPLSKSNRYALKFPLLYDSALLVQWLFIWALMHY
jgi:4-hydroxybenzoate polyprenyltransferase